MKKLITFTSLILLAISVTPVLAMDDEDREVPPEGTRSGQGKINITYVGAFENHGNIQTPTLTLKNPNSLVNQGMIESPNREIYK